jgi:hypothetical protein
MNQQKILELALEALSPDPYKSEWVVQQDISKAITAIKAALEAKDWVGLTDEDRFELAKAQHGWEDLLISAEAKLKEKNG